MPKPNTQLLRSRRERIPLTKAELAEQVGVAEITIRRWETEGLRPQPAHVRRLCAILDASPAQLGYGPEEAASDDAFRLVPPLEPRLIDRPDNRESLVAILVEASAADPAEAVAVCGPGGFGKTTLATQVCHDVRIRELFSEILWVETGEGCTPAQIGRAHV